MMSYNTTSGDLSGAFGTEALNLFAEIARLVQVVTQEVRAWTFLLQQVSVACSVAMWHQCWGPWVLLDF